MIISLLFQSLFLSSLYIRANLSLPMAKPLRLAKVDGVTYWVNHDSPMESRMRYSSSRMSNGGAAALEIEGDPIEDQPSFKLPAVGRHGSQLDQLQAVNERLNSLQQDLNNLWDSHQYTRFWKLVWATVDKSLDFRLLAFHRVDTGWLRKRTLAEVVSLLQYTFGPGPLRDPIARLWIPKPNGKRRPLGIPKLGARIYFAQLALILNVIGTKVVSRNQHGYVSGRGTVTASKEVVKALNKGLGSNLNIYEYDLKGFFDNISHDVIERMLVELLHVPAADLPRWRTILKISVLDLETRVSTPTSAGMPQGLAISPIISVLVLEYMKFLAPMGEDTHIIQYSDDGLLVMAATNPVVIEARIHELKARCVDGISIAEDKSRLIDPAGTFKYLGLIYNSTTGNIARAGSTIILGNIYNPDGIQWELISSPVSTEPLECETTQTVKGRNALLEYIPDSATDLVLNRMVTHRYSLKDYLTTAEVLDSYLGTLGSKPIVPPTKTKLKSNCKGVAQETDRKADKSEGQWLTLLRNAHSNKVGNVKKNLK